MSRLSPFIPPTVALVKEPSRSTHVVVVGLASAGGDAHPVILGLPSGLARAYSKNLSSEVLALATELGATTEVGHTTVLPPSGAARALVVGLGEVDVTPHQVRTATASALRTIMGNDRLSGPVAISLDLTDPELLQAAVEGALLGGYAIDRRGKDKRTAIPPIELISSNTRANASIEQALAVATAVATARDWVNLPPNLLYPDTFAGEAREHLNGLKIDVEVLDEKALDRGGYGGIMAVGGGSERKPRLVRAEYSPRGAKQTLALVGKGITFDSGGLDIKPVDGMYDMKYDMAGAAAVLAALGAIARLGLSVRVVAYAAMAENMPSGGAYRPSDVLTMYGGTTVENANTDAEGRLVMADALGRASKDQAALIVDVATLTGACTIALGNRIAGLMASDDVTADMVLDAAEVAGEEFWHLPIPDHIAKGLDSRIADVKSSGDRRGGALAAAAFLRRFVPEDAHWAHLDIAGPAWNDKDPYAEVPAGGTGFAVRTLCALAQTMSL